MTVKCTSSMWNHVRDCFRHSCTGLSHTATKVARFASEKMKRYPEVAETLMGMTVIGIASPMGHAFNLIAKKAIGHRPHPETHSIISQEGLDDATATLMILMIATTTALALKCLSHCAYHIYTCCKREFREVPTCAV